ncbi:MAG: hypothetical protein IT318_10440 [Anaerolineales bacterium]|nr:hypothetical protein [Anaerolineales bacterium]
MPSESDAWLTPKNAVGRGGPIAGGALSMLGAVLALIGFLLPWASCAGQPLSGLQIAGQPGPQGQNLAWIYLVPFLAIGCLGIALSIVPLAAWRRVPPVALILASGLVGLLAVAAAAPLVVVYTSLRAAQSQLESELGLFSGLAGEAFTLERGYWLTAAGLAMILAGAVLGSATALLGAWLPSRQR